jgi:hypothetical protein
LLSRFALDDAPALAAGRRCRFRLARHSAMENSAVDSRSCAPIFCLAVVFGAIDLIAATSFVEADAAIAVNDPR